MIESRTTALSERPTADVPPPDDVAVPVAHDLGVAAAHEPALVEREQEAAPERVGTIEDDGENPA